MSDRETQQATEWAICLIRWGLLLCILVIAILDPAETSSLTTLVPLLVVAGAYNLLITVLLTFRLFFRFLPIISLFMDIIASLILIFVTGGVSSPLFFLPIFPILVAALRFGWQIGLFTAFVFALNQGFHLALEWDSALGSTQIFNPGLDILLFFLVAGIGGVMSQRLLTEGGAGPGRANLEGQVVPEHFKVIYEMASSLSATLNYQRVLEAILDISRLGFDDLGMRIGEAVGLVLLYEQEGFLTPASYRNLVTVADESRRIKGTMGIVGDAIAASQAFIGGPAVDDPELRAFESLKSCKSMICVPLRAGFETYGAVLFASVKAHAYTPEHTELLTIFCNQATIALQNASLYQSLREERDKIVNKEEEARHKLARDLHDGPTQDVAAIAMRLNFARLLVERDPVRAKSELERLEDLAHRTVKEIRSMLFTLRPIILETEGLVAALNQYAENLRENDGLPVHVQAEKYQDRLDMETQGVVFAILEEAINNARKHAQASNIWVRLAVERDLFVAHVIDDGTGFDVATIENNYSSRGSLGMINLKERADLVNGTLNIESAPGQGTRITLLVPIDDITS